MRQNTMDSDHVSVTLESPNVSQGEKSIREQKDLILKNNKNKLKNLRSIKLNKSPSLRPSSARRPRTHLRNIVVELPSDVESPLYSTSSSQFSTLSQKSAPTLKRRSSFNKGVRTLTRMSSKKQKKPVMKISRPTRPENSKSEYDRLSVVSSSSSSKSVKVRPQNSEHSFSTSSADRTKRTSSIYSKPNLTRKASLRPLRVSTKTKRSPMVKHSEISNDDDPSVERATCSSALKGSKMASSVQIQHGEIDPEEAHSAMKVCPFSYCSLHGHRHRNAPPLKRLISIRRRLLKNDRNTKIENRKDTPRGNKVNIGVQTDLVEEVDSWSEAESIDLGNNGDEEEEEEAKISESYSLLTNENNPDQTTDFCSGEHDSEHEGGHYTSVPTEPCCDSSESSDEIVDLSSKSGSSSESLGELENEHEQPIKEEKENLEPGHRFFCFPPKGSEPGSPNDASQRMQLKDQKYVKMWRLMYKHAVKEVPGKPENKTEQEVQERALSEDDPDNTSDSVNESYQMDAVILVQKAFDEILLPEIQHQGQVVNEEENAKVANTTSDFGDKSSEQKVSKSWSALKKIFILKRFVKALDKVKRIQRGTPRHLPLQPEPGAEKVNLRRQSSEERKNAEDWMLDYALQQVVSKLDPDQQRQVAMLVKAFETVLPIPDLNSPSPKWSVETRTKVDQSVENEGNFRNVLTARTCSRGQGTDFPEAESREQELNVGYTKMSKGSQNFSNVLTARTCSQSLVTDFPEAESREQELDIDSTKTDKGAVCDDQRHPFIHKTISAGNELSEVKKSERGTTESSRSLLGKSVSGSTTEVNQVTQSEKQSYMRLWGYVYKHMLDNIPGEEGTKPTDNESEGKNVENVKTTTQIFALKGSPSADESNQKAVLRRIEAIRLIEKAIDEIILPDNQDSPSPTDGQSTGSDEEPQTKKKTIVIHIDKERGTTTITSQSSDSIPEKGGETAALCTGEDRKTSVPKKQMSRNWSNLKQKILLRRFIKAFDNARKFNPRGPRFLAPEGDAEAEKVSLKHQEMDERKNAEEWMVDHALQQAVARLTPDRKKKVQLLVQAFEAVKT